MVYPRGFKRGSKVDFIDSAKVIRNTFQKFSRGLRETMGKENKNVCVYYCSTYYKAVRVGGGG